MLYVVAVALKEESLEEGITVNTFTIQEGLEQVGPLSLTAQSCI